MITLDDSLGCDFITACDYDMITLNDWLCNQADGKKKAKRKKKDANAPKRASSAYMIWMGANRSRIVAANPGIKVAVVVVV